MSQYPYHYPGYATPDPYAQLLGPARRAAITTFVVGGLALLGALCMGGLALAGPEEIIAGMIEGARQPEVTTGIMRLGLAIIAVVVLTYALVKLVLGIFIWRGSGAAAITAIVLACLALLLLLFNTLTSLPNARGLGGAELGGFLCFTVVVPLTMLVYLILLIQAAKSIRQYKDAQSAYQQQYWQYQQQQQQYGQMGYPQAPPPGPSDPNGVPPHDPAGPAST
jgi:hypothetical protein